MDWFSVYKQDTSRGQKVKVPAPRPAPRIIIRTTSRPTVKPAPSPTVKPAPSPAPKPVPKTITYMLNDPATPVFKTVLPPTAPASPLFTVVGYKGGGDAWNTLPGQAANVYTTIVNLLNFINTVAVRPMNGWAATRQLQVIPRAGRMLNAYYDRSTLSFFFDYNRTTGQEIRTADSSDIVSHELGHAILDFYRPELFSMPLTEIWAFHESFGDFMAIVTMLLHDETVQQCLHETGGNLRQNNLICRIAEQFGAAVASVNPTQDNMSLRNAWNSLQYVDPLTLPRSSSNLQTLTSTPHSFSRVMTGALYEVMVAVYEQNCASMPPAEALKQAVRQTVRYLLVSVANARIESRYFMRLAHGMLWADHSTGGVYHDRMWDVFLRRKIITGDATSQFNWIWHAARLLSRSTLRATSRRVYALMVFAGQTGEAHTAR